MNAVKLFVPITLVAMGLWFKSAAEGGDKPGPATVNATCGFCGRYFLAGWAATTRCPWCRATMSTKRATKAYRPEQPFPLLDLPPSQEERDKAARERAKVAEEARMRAFADRKRREAENKQRDAELAPLAKDKRLKREHNLYCKKCNHFFTVPDDSPVTTSVDDIRFAEMYGHCPECDALSIRFKVK